MDGACVCGRGREDPPWWWQAWLFSCLSGWRRGLIDLMKTIPNLFSFIDFCLVWLSPKRETQRKRSLCVCVQKGVRGEGWWGVVRVRWCVVCGEGGAWWGEGECGGGVWCEVWVVVHGVCVCVVRVVVWGVRHDWQVCGGVWGVWWCRWWCGGGVVVEWECGVVVQVCEWGGAKCEVCGRKWCRCGGESDPCPWSFWGNFSFWRWRGWLLSIMD